MDGTKVGVLKQSYKVGLAGFLKGGHSRALETQVGLEVLGNFTNQTLERQLADEQLSGLLVATDFTQSHSSRLVTVGLLHSPSGWGALTGGLGGELFPGSFASSGFASSLLGTSHCSSNDNV